MQESIAPLLDMLMHITLLFVNATILRRVLKLLCKHTADTKYIKALITATLIAMIHALLACTLRDRLGPFTLAGSILVAFFALKGLCWIEWSQAVIVAPLYCAIIIGLNTGAAKAADRIAPERVTFSMACENTSVFFASMRCEKDNPINWEWLFARAFEAVAYLTQPKEAEMLAEDMQKGMEFYHERKKMLAMASTNEPSSEGQPLLFDAIETLATTEVSHLTVDIDQLKGLTETGTNAPPQDIDKSLAQIKANLTSESGRAAFAKLVKTGALGASELASDAYQLGQSNTNVATQQAMLAKTISDAMGDISMSDTNAQADAMLLTAIALQFARAKANNQPSNHVDILNQTTNSAAHADASLPLSEFEIQTTPTGTPARTNQPAKHSRPNKLHPSHKKLKTTGMVRERGGKFAVLCNGKVVSPGQRITVEHEGTTFAWQLKGITNNRAVWVQATTNETTTLSLW